MLLFLDAVKLCHVNLAAIMRYMQLCGGAAEELQVGRRLIDNSLNNLLNLVIAQ
ncbi:hypothetical protein MYVALT_G_00600 [Candidatus Vallotia tarda]|uniref:Uncharacterized protein n=1 Tax=Candidatus Vallotiella hemipterorum TaxID=1177213 RepID=A0A916JR28_9BURK|nr:hypothetical protein MYVALT_G_00600 [Candidatus Vallotia tarda]